MAQSTKAKLNNHLVVGELNLQFQNMPLPFPYYNNPPTSLSFSLSLSIYLSQLLRPILSTLPFLSISFFLQCMSWGGEGCPRVMMDQQRVIIEVTQKEQSRNIILIPIIIGEVFICTQENYYYHQIFNIFKIITFSYCKIFLGKENFCVIFSPVDQ